VARQQAVLLRVAQQAAVPHLAVQAVLLRVAQQAAVQAGLRPVAQQQAE